MERYPEWYTSFAIDAMYYHMALDNLKRAIKNKQNIDTVNNKIVKLDRQGQEILASYNGDKFAAADELEPIAITIVDYFHTDLAEAYKPYLEALSLVYMLSVASLEAHINIRAEKSFKKTQMGHFDKLSLEGKWLFYPIMHGKVGFDPGGEPFQSFSKIIKSRNNLVHFKNRQEPWQAGKAPNFIDSLGLDLRAEHAVVTVKKMMISLAKQFNEGEPEWLRDEPISYFTFFEAD